MKLALVAALVLSVACAGGATAVRSAGPSATVAPSPIGQIDVTDMMGAFPPATFFVVRPGGVTAVALLNHATKYTIPIDFGEAQVVTATEAGRVYVLDQTRAGARIRWFESATGSERRSRVLPDAVVVPTGAGHGTLAFDSTTGEIFALLREGPSLALEEFEGFTLEPVRQRLGDLRCGERILASAGRVVLACLADGGLVVERDDRRSFRVDARMQLVAVAMSRNGTLIGGATDGRLVRLAPGATELETIDTLRGRGARLLPDGLGAQGDCCFTVGVLDSVANPRITVLAGGLTVVSFPESTPPTGGILVEPPFAYYTVGKTARHVDLLQGFAEVMASFSEVALPGAVAAY